MLNLGEGQAWERESVQWESSPKDLSLHREVWNNHQDPKPKI